MKLNKQQLKMLLEASKSFQQCDKDMPDTAPENANENWKYVIKEIKAAIKKGNKMNLLDKLRKKNKPVKRKSKGGYSPTAGYAWNPFLSYPRNFPCWCGSGKKFKKCCEPLTAPTIKMSEYENVKCLFNHLMERFGK